VVFQPSFKLFHLDILHLKKRRTSKSPNGKMECPPKETPSATPNATASPTNMRNGTAVNYSSLSQKKRKNETLDAVYIDILTACCTDVLKVLRTSQVFQ
jgi:hypothetical protein